MRPPSANILDIIVDDGRFSPYAREPSRQSDWLWSWGLELCWCTETEYTCGTASDAGNWITRDTDTTDSDWLCGRLLWLIPIVTGAADGRVFSSDCRLPKLRVLCASVRIRQSRYRCLRFCSGSCVNVVELWWNYKEEVESLFWVHTVESRHKTRKTKC